MRTWLWIIKHRFDNTPSTACGLYKMIKTLCGIVIIHRGLYGQQIEHISPVEGPTESSLISSIVLLLFGGFLEATHLSSSAALRFAFFYGDNFWLVLSKKY